MVTGPNQPKLDHCVYYSIFICMSVDCEETLSSFHPLTRRPWPKSPDKLLGKLVWKTNPMEDPAEDYIYIVSKMYPHLLAHQVLGLGFPHIHISVHLHIRIAASSTSSLRLVDWFFHLLSQSHQHQFHLCTWLFHHLLR